MHSSNGVLSVKGLSTPKEEDSHHTNIGCSKPYKEFHFHVSASSITLGMVLAQPDEVDIDHQIYFSSWKLSSMENNYTMTEREGLEMIYTL